MPTDSLENLLLAIGPQNKNKETRYASFLELESISQDQPGLLAPYWGILKEYLSSANTSSKYNALHLVANLAGRDASLPFEDVFEAYFAVLDHSSVTLVSHAAEACGQVARARPDLEPRITQRLLAAGKGLTNPERIDLVRGYVIRAFDDYFETAQDPQMILGYVMRALECASPETRKRANEFLNRRGIAIKK